MVKIHVIFRSDASLIYVRDDKKHRDVGILEIVSIAYVNGHIYKHIDRVIDWVITDIAELLKRGKL